MRRFRYGVQVNSLGPDRGAAGEQRPADRAGDARRDAVEERPRPRRAAARVERGPRPAAALGPAVVAAAAAGAGLRVRPAGVRRHLRGLDVIEAKVEQLVGDARAEIDRVQALGGAIAAVESGYMKQELVSSHSARRARIENGEEIVVGVNRFETTEPSPLTADLDAAIQAADPEAERSAVAGLEAWRERARPGARSTARSRALAAAAKTEANLMEATLVAARAGATTGEWAGHAARGVRRVPGAHRGLRRRRRRGGRAGAHRRARAGRGAPARSSADGCGCWSASRASTGTPTAPSRWPCGPGTQGSRSSTRASG